MPKMRHQVIKLLILQRVLFSFLLVNSSPVASVAVRMKKPNEIHTLYAARGVGGARLEHSIRARACPSVIIRGWIME